MTHPLRMPRLPETVTTPPGFKPLPEAVRWLDHHPVSTDERGRLTVSTEIRTVETYLYALRIDRDVLDDERALMGKCQDVTAYVIQEAHASGAQWARPVELTIVQDWNWIPPQYGVLERLWRRLRRAKPERHPVILRAEMRAA